MYLYILLDTILAAVANKYSLTTAGCEQRWRTNWIQLDLVLGVERRIVGCRGMTNHNKAAVCVSVSQPIAAFVGHLCWQLPVAAFGTTVGTLILCP